VLRHKDSDDLQLAPSTATDDEGVDPAGEPAGRLAVVVAALLVLGALVAAVAVVVAVSRSHDQGRVTTIVVPLGTAERQASGQRVTLMPAGLRLHVGDTFRVVNHDTEVHDVGPYVIAGGQTLQQTYVHAGVIQGSCSLSPTGQVTITIRP
jgi:plastocyanin